MIIVGMEIIVIQIMMDMEVENMVVENMVVENMEVENMEVGNMKGVIMFLLHHINYKNMNIATNRKDLVCTPKRLV